MSNQEISLEKTNVSRVNYYLRRVFEYFVKIVREAAKFDDEIEMKFEWSCRLGREKTCGAKKMDERGKNRDAKSFCRNST